MLVAHAAAEDAVAGEVARLVYHGLCFREDEGLGRDWRALPDLDRARH